MLAQFRPAWSAGLAQFRPAYSGAITVVTDIDAGNVDPAKVVITNAESDEPTVYVDYRTAAGGWRHLHWAVENAGGKRPIFEMNWSSRISSTAPTPAWALLWTQDFITWTKAPSRTLASGVMTCQFTDPLPAGRVYLATQPLWPQSGADTLATELLTTYSSIASPTASANASGVYNVSPAETDENGRAIGEHEQYSIRLEFGGSTTDGGPKRRLVMLSGIHAAGESHAHTAFKAALDWIINDASQAAQDFRANWDVFCYFNLTPNGYYGGHHRTNFRSSTDPNRNWAAGTPLQEIGAVKSAITTDLNLGSGGRWDAMFSWHAFYSHTSDFQCWVIPEDDNPDTRSPIMQAMFDKGALFFNDAPVLDTSGTNNTDVWWAKSQGAKVAFDTELQQSADTSPAFFQSVGTKWVRTLQAVDADGWFVGDTALSAAVTASATTSAALTTKIALTGALSASASTTAALQTGSTMAGSLSASAGVSGDLTTEIRFAADAISSSVVGGTLTTEIRFIAAAAATAVTSADLTTGITLAGAAACSATTSGQLAGDILLSGDLSASASASGDLTTEIRLSASVLVNALADASLTAGATMTGALSASAAANGDLTTAIRCAAAISVSAGTSADLTTAIPLAAAITATAAASGVITLPLRLSADLVAQAVATGALTTRITMSADALAAATIVGELLEVNQFRMGRVVTAPAGRSIAIANILSGD